MRPFAALLALLVVACGGAAPAAPVAPVGADLDLAAAPAAPGAGSPRPSRRETGPPADRPPPAAAAGPTPVRPTIYRGRPIDLDLKEAELADVFRLLADAGDVDIVVADDVTGKVTLRLRRVPWDQALMTVVKVKRLALERSGSVYLVRRP